jgi:hypothetical protein
MKRLEFDAGAAPRPEFIKHLTKDARKYQAAEIAEQVMLSFTSDPYHPGNTTLTCQTLESTVSASARLPREGRGRCGTSACSARIATPSRRLSPAWTTTSP